jgi:hypothetical protein
VALGPHSKNVTVPVGVPPVLFPDTVTVSVFESPNAIDALVGADVVPDIA